MNLPKIIVGAIFILLGALVLYKSVKTIRKKGLWEGSVEIVIGIGFVLLGLIMWSGYID